MAVLSRDSARQEAFELSGADGVLEFADGFGFDLADALAGDLEDAADFFERVGVPVADAVAQLDDLALAVGEGLEDLLDLVLEHLLRGALDGIVGLLILDEVAEIGILGFADGTIQRDWVAADFEHAAGLADRHLGALGDLLDGRLAPKLLHEHLADVPQLAHRLDHVHWNANRAGMIGDGAGDRLADPPGGVGAELE